MEYNVWSGGDYLQNVTGTSGTIDAEISTDYSYNGDYSFKLTSSANEYQYRLLGAVSRLNGETVTGSLTILNNTGNNIILRITQAEGDIYQNVTIPSSSEPQNVSISKTLTADSVVSLRIITYNIETFYIDNISCIIQ